MTPCMVYYLSIRDGVLAQLGEHLLCTQGVIGSIPIRSTMIDQRRFLRESFFVQIKRKAIINKEDAYSDIKNKRFPIPLSFKQSSIRNLFL